MNRWKRVAASLVRLADDQRGKPEGDVARQKLQQILAKYPAARSQPDVVKFMARELVMRGDFRPEAQPEMPLSMADFFRMRRAGVDTDGSWRGSTFNDAVREMEKDLRERMAARMAAVLERQIREVLHRPVTIHVARSYGVREDDITTADDSSSGSTGPRWQRQDEPSKYDW